MDPSRKECFLGVGVSAKRLLGSSINLNRYKFLDFAILLSINTSLTESEDVLGLSISVDFLFGSLIALTMALESKYSFTVYFCLQIMQKWRVEFDGELDIQFDFLLAPKSPVSLRLVEW